MRWIAGYFDGEGCVEYYKDTPRLRIGNTHLPTLVYIQRCLGGTVSAQVLRANQRPFFKWSVHGKNALHVASLLIPFLREKKDQAELIFQIRALPKGERGPLCDHLKRPINRGVHEDVARTQTP